MIYVQSISFLRTSDDIFSSKMIALIDGFPQNIVFLDIIFSSLSGFSGIEHWDLVGSDPVKGWTLFIVLLMRGSDDDVVDDYDDDG